MDEKTLYPTNLSLEEWKFFQRLKQLVKSYETGMMLIAWDQNRLESVRVVGKAENVG
jgi:hypothetical protein